MDVKITIEVGNVTKVITFSPAGGDHNTLIRSVPNGAAQSRRCENVLEAVKVALKDMVGLGLND